MKDYFEEDLAVKDKVIFIKQRYHVDHPAIFEKGTVVSMTVHRAMIEAKDGLLYSRGETSVFKIQKGGE